MPHIGLITQQKELLKTKLEENDLATAIIDMMDVGVNTNGVIKTTLAYVAKTDYYETKNRNTTWFFTVPNFQVFGEEVMGLASKHINALRDKGITNPRDLANFDFGDFDSVIQSVKGKAALPGLAQIRLKQACDFF